MCPVVSTPTPLSFVAPAGPFPYLRLALATWKCGLALLLWWMLSKSMVANNKKTFDKYCWHECFWLNLYNYPPPATPTHPVHYTLSLTLTHTLSLTCTHTHPPLHTHCPLHSGTAGNSHADVRKFESHQRRPSWGVDMGFILFSKRCKIKEC